MFHKYADCGDLSSASVHSAEIISSNSEINDRFEKFAAELRKVAPKAKDFIYFSTVVMTAAENALLDSNGNVKVGSDGNPLTAKWETNGDSVKWICSDSELKPFKNNNGDIFPSSELIKHHKKFIGTPVCIDHRSSSVDGVRGIVLDTYYDYKNHKVIALMAVDKILFPDLARKISTGVSSSVSMGTVVKKCVCFDCGQVARSERDFCKHMRKEANGFGEINFDLEPIEISIVNNPADPTAKIRTVFASAQNLKNRKFSNVRDQIEQLENALIQIKSSIDELKGISSEAIISEEQDISENMESKVADISALFTELKMLKTSMEKTLEDLNKQSNKDISMADRKSMEKQSYWQGAGGVNEPTPGKVKYDIDPANEQLRNGEDKQMLQTKEFGGEKDDSVKSEARPLGDKAARRKEALDKAKKNLSKEGYWQGGGGVNEPTPGKPKYEVDPLNEQVRMEDKQMVGQKPFPGVGDVDGLHPSPESAEQKDELERKKMLARANSLVASFVKAANTDGTDNLGQSAWNVFVKSEKGRKLVLTASVDEITSGQTEKLYDVVATKEFGSKMLEKIREVGLEKAASLYKKAQAVPAPAASPAPAPAPAPMDMNAMPGGEGAPANDTAMDEGGKGDPKEVAEKLAEKTRDSAAELLEAVRDMNGSQSEMGELENDIKALPKAANITLGPAAEMRKKLENMLLSAAKKSLADLKNHYSELKLINDMADEETVKNASLRGMIETAFEEAKAANANAENILRSYAKYASGVENLIVRVKKAEDEDCSEEEMKDENKADDDFMSQFEDEPMPETEPMPALDDLNPDHNDPLMDAEVDEDFDGPPTVKDMDMPEDKELDALAANDGLVVELAPGSPVPAGAKPVAEDPNAPKMAATDLTTKEGRAAYRMKLAKEMMSDSEDASKIKFHPLLADANKLADGQTQLDVKPSDNLGKVETLPEANKRMLEVAKAPPKVKKEAENLNRMIVAGKINPADFDRLVAEGLDSDVVKYWKEFYGQVDGGQEFAKLLTAEAEMEKMKEEMESYKVKTARCFELANEMARVGLITNERAAIARQVEESMKWNDDAFDSFKKVIAKRAALPMVKSAGIIPQVGLVYEESAPVVDDLQAELERAFSGRRY